MTVVEATGGSHERDNLRHRHAPGQVPVPDRFRAGRPAGGGRRTPPLGEGAGPSPEQLLGAAVANCLCSSLLFAANNFKGDPGRLTATATCETGRNENNRLRVKHIKIDIALGASPEQLPHLDRGLAQFEEFCTVTQSVRAGIPVTVSLQGPDDAGSNRPRGFRQPVISITPRWAVPSRPVRPSAARPGKNAQVIFRLHVDKFLVGPIADRHRLASLPAALLHITNELPELGTPE